MYLDTVQLGVSAMLFFSFRTLFFGLFFLSFYGILRLLTIGLEK